MCSLNGMSLVVVSRHRDGKLFPAGGYRTDEELRRMVNQVHVLRCRDDLSYRMIVARLAEEGFRVSLGSVYRYRVAYGPCRYEEADDG